MLSLSILLPMRTGWTAGDIHLFREVNYHNELESLYKLLFGIAGFSNLIMIYE